MLASWTLAIGRVQGQESGTLRQTPAADAAPGRPDLQIARGRVFEDLDGDRRCTAGDRPLAGIRVSNGSAIVRTDGEGRYELPVSDDGVVFVIKPRGFMTDINELNLPRFFYLHKPAGSPALKYPGVRPTGPLPQSIDFPLYARYEPDRFEVILFGDPQPRDRTEVDYIAHDVVDGLAGKAAAFGVTLGDIVFDDLSVFQPLNETIALIGIPWYNVIGNHDINTDVRERHLINETFESHYGPSWYSFDYGPVHFIVVDNIGWRERPDQPGQFGMFAQIGPEQLEFIRRDLELLPPQQMVVLMMHIPLTNTTDTQELFRLIEQRPVCLSIAAHTHNHTHHFFGPEQGWRGKEPHHHIVNVTVSGSWWSGKRDERGIPHATMSDGGPNGYSILTLDGDRYNLDYFAAGVDAGSQMRIVLPDSVGEGETSGLPVYVNVFNGSSLSTVQFRVDGADQWQSATRVEEIDPFYKALYDEDQAQGLLFGGNRLGKPNLSSHLWRGALPERLGPGAHIVEVRTIDMHGREFRSQRSLRVTADEAAASGPVEPKSTGGAGR